MDAEKFGASPRGGEEDDSHESTAFQAPKSGRGHAVITLPTRSAKVKRPVLVASGQSEIALAGDRTLVVGRGAECDIVLADESASRKHATFVWANGELRVEDMQSSNGTRVAGVALVAGKSRVVHIGAVVEIGDAVILLRAQGDIDELAEAKAAPHRSVAPMADAPVERIDRLVELVARKSISVILHGETGVGKEVIARRIHELSPRRSEAFVALNCAAIAENLMERELFGYEKGAFTGATQAKMGLLEAGDRGTALLDEIGDLALPLQAKLLRALEAQEVLPVGAVKPRKINVRFLAATHRNWEELVAKDRFRADLFSAQRHHHSRSAAAGTTRTHSRALARGAPRRVRAIGRLARAQYSRRREAHGWPGNVRELRNVMERALVFADERDIEASDIHLSDASVDDAHAPEARATSVSPPADAAFVPGPEEHDVGSPEDRARVVAALERANCNQTYAAELLGMSRRSLVYRIGIYGIPCPRKRS